MLDERLTTVTATRELHASGRTSRQGRSVVDQVAATVLLQAALDQMSSTGSPVGELVTDAAEAES
jgi:putative Holliday junction resolvase